MIQEVLGSHHSKLGGINSMNAKQSEQLSFPSEYQLCFELLFILFVCSFYSRGASLLGNQKYIHK